MKIFVTVVEANKAKTITTRVIALASLLPFLIISIDIVDDIAFSKLSTLYLTNRVAKEINPITVSEFKFS